MNWFTQCQTLDEVKAEYRRLCFLHHPDHGGDGATMQAINMAYRSIMRGGLGVQTLPPSSHVWRPAYTPSQRPEARPHQPADVGAEYSRPYLWRIWDAAPWQRASGNHWMRTVGDHTVTLIYFPVERPHLWAVRVDDHFSTWAHETRAQAEADGFNMLAEQLGANGGMGDKETRGPGDK